MAADAASAEAASADALLAFAALCAFTPQRVLAHWQFTERPLPSSSALRDPPRSRLHPLIRWGAAGTHT